jgi:hypothetical protein
MQRRNEAIHSLDKQESLTELIGDLANQSASLVRDEMALAKQEISEKLEALRASLVVIALGAVLALIAALVLCTALIAGLSLLMPVWAAALLVGGVFAIVAGIIVSTGVGKLKRTSLKPKQTIKTLEEDKKWLKEIT